MNVSDLRRHLERLEENGYGDVPVYVDPPGPPSTVVGVYGRDRDEPQTDYVEIHH